MQQRDVMIIGVFTQGFYSKQILKFLQEAGIHYRSEVDADGFKADDSQDINVVDFGYDFRVAMYIKWAYIAGGMVNCNTICNGYAESGGAWSHLASWRPVEGITYKTILVRTDANQPDWSFNCKILNALPPEHQEILRDWYDSLPNEVALD